MIRNFLYVLILVFSFNACGYGQKDMKQISTSELKNKLSSADTSYVLLDVRTVEELTGQLAKIDKAVNIPLQELDARMGELDKYKDKEIYVICRSGRRSEAATSMLKQKGFNAVNVIGGMLAYKKTE